MKEPTTDDVQIFLREIVDGIRSDVFSCFEAVNLLQMISANASEINNSDFGFLFGYMQKLIQSQIILLVTKIFEKPDHYKLKSIPAALKYIEENEESFSEIECRDDLSLDLLRKMGCKSKQTGKPFFDFFSKYWANYDGRIKETKIKARFLRDKVTAHHEKVDDNFLPNISLPEIIELLEHAKIYISIIDYVYLGLVSVDYEGNYFANSQSKSVGIILKNLLVKSKIIDIQKGRMIVKNLIE